MATVTTPATTRAADLSIVDLGGLVAEDVLREIINITEVDRPLIDSIGRTSAKNVKKEFVNKVLAAPNKDNAFVENEDLTAKNDSKQGLRYYNYCQQMGKVIKTSQRGRDVDHVGGVDEFLQQLIDAGEELKMDEEAALVSRNPATAEVITSGSEAASKTAGAACWAMFYSDRGASGANATLDGSGSDLEDTGGGPTTGPVAGDARPFTETLLRSTLRKGWQGGARYNMLMSTGDMIETIGNYMFTSTARVATMQTDVMQSNRTGANSGNGARSGGVVAQGAVNMFVGNFGVVTLTPNRQMEVYDSGDSSPVDVVDVLFIDTRYPMVATLHDYDSKDLAERGLYDQQVIYCDRAFIPGSVQAIATVADIDPTQPMVA